MWLRLTMVILTRPAHSPLEMSGSSIALRLGNCCEASMPENHFQILWTALYCLLILLESFKHLEKKSKIQLSDSHIAALKGVKAGFSRCYLAKKCAPPLLVSALVVSDDLDQGSGRPPPAGSGRDYSVRSIFGDGASFRNRVTDPPWHGHWSALTEVTHREWQKTQNLSLRCIILACHKQTFLDEFM